MKQLCFIHLPKTAGTSFRIWMRRAFDGSVFWHGGKEDGFIHDHDSPDGMAHLASFAAIGGHLDIDDAVLRRVPTEKVICGVLRDPLERAISHYDYIRRKPDHGAHAEVVGKTLYQSLELDDRFFRLVHNAQFHSLIGSQDTQALPYAYIIGRIDALDRFVAAVSSEFGVPRLALSRENSGEDGYAAAVRAQPDFDRAEAILRSSNLRDYQLVDAVDGVLRVRAGGRLPLRADSRANESVAPGGET